MDYEKLLCEENKNTCKKKHLVLAAFICLLVVTTVVVVSTVESQNKLRFRGDGEAHPVVESTCAATFYPELCVSTINSVATTAVTSSKDVLLTALNYTIYTVQRNYVTVKNMSMRRNVSGRDMMALRDCLEMIDDTLEELRDCEKRLKNFGSANYTLSDHKEYLMTMFSAAQTNQDSCLDGFSHGNADKTVLQALQSRQTHVFRLVSNVMAMTKNLSDTEISNMSKQRISSSKTSVGEADNTIRNGQDWPEWLSMANRRLLQASDVTPNITVAADGSGDYLTVSEAVAAAPNASSRYVIWIRAGVYREFVEIPRRKTNLMFIGDGRTNTIITASRSVAANYSTFNSYTVAVVGSGFLARDITIQNAAGPDGHQAVALRVNADLCAFYRCGFLGYQDTLYVHSLRQFYTNCVVVGTVDFIFGNAAVVLQNCDIRPRRPNPSQRNMVTAQGRDDPNQNTGIVIQQCSISANNDLLPVQSEFSSYLGRPWRLYSRTVVMQTDITDVINPAGWYPWNGDFALDTLFYAEYQNTGAGADTSNRVNWPGFRVLTSDAEAQPFTAGSFIAGAEWLPGTGFPYSLGL